MIEPGPYADLVRALVRRRQIVGLSQAQLDQVLGTPERLVSKWECGDRKPSIFALVCWADALGMKWVPLPDITVSAVRAKVAKRANGEGAVAA